MHECVKCDFQQKEKGLKGTDLPIILIKCNYLFSF